MNNKKGMVWFVKTINFDTKIGSIQQYDNAMCLIEERIGVSLDTSYEKTMNTDRCR